MPAVATLLAHYVVLLHFLYNPKKRVKYYELWTDAKNIIAKQDIFDLIVIIQLPDQKTDRIHYCLTKNNVLLSNENTIHPFIHAKCQ